MLSVWPDSNISAADKLSPESPLFNNNTIRFKNATLFFPQCIKNNLVYVKDMVVNNVIIHFDTFRQLCDSPNALLMYNCIYNALYKIRQLFVFNVDTTEEAVTMFCNENVRNVSRKMFYKKLNKTESPIMELHWSRKLESDFLKQYWMIAFESTIESRLHILHWKILMNIYPTSIILSKMNIRDTEICEQCGVRDTLEHFFFSCDLLEKLWREVNHLISSFVGRRIELTWHNALLGVLTLRGICREDVKKINLIILIAKLAVSKSKYGSGLEPSLVFESEKKLRNFNS